MDAFATRRAPPRCNGIRADILRGLSATPKQLPSKYFYDAAGSALFEQICQQPEYYLTRAEFEILERHGDAIAAALGPRVALVEFGCGAGGKTRLLLRRLRDPVAYQPIEISPAALAQTTAAFAAEFPGLDVQPVCADFTRRLQLARPAQARRTALLFPGSTLGNFDRRAAGALLRRIHRLIGRNGCAVIGIDLQKDVRTLEAAYNDAAGITARFTLNLLTRINRELGADFDLAHYVHRARYARERERIETHIVSTADHTVHVADRVFTFTAGEAMLVEYSCKYSLDGFAALAARAGLGVHAVWTDALRRCAIVLLERQQRAGAIASMARPGGAADHDPLARAAVSA